MRRWRVVAGLTAVAGAMTALAGCGHSEAAGTTTPASPATPIASTSASPSPSPSATLEPPVDGALPVPAYPASAIPWGEVGPGWFLLSYDADAARIVWPDTGQARFPSLNATVMLVSPTGDPYFARGLGGFGPGRIEAWLGRSTVVLDGYAQTNSDETFHGPLSSVDLAAGTTTVINKDAYDFWGIQRVLPDGRFVTRNVGGDGGESVSVLGPDFTPQAGGCSSSYGGVTTLAPDGARVVCLENEYPKSAVMLYNIADGSSAKIDTFQYFTDSYTTLGWWDPNSFVLTRVDDNGTTLRWAYDVSTAKIRDLNAALSNGTPAEYAAGIAGYRVVTAGATAEVQGFDGSLRATLPCAGPQFSGAFALSVCGDPGGQISISVANLDTGVLSTIATFTSGASSGIGVFPLPDGATG